jgi:hypothetical protein
VSVEPTKKSSGWSHRALARAEAETDLERRAPIEYDVWVSYGDRFVQYTKKPFGSYASAKEWAERYFHRVPNIWEIRQR